MHSVVSIVLGTAVSSHTPTVRVQRQFMCSGPAFHVKDGERHCCLVCIYICCLLQSGRVCEWWGAVIGTLVGNSEVQAATAVIGVFHEQAYRTVQVWLVLPAENLAA